MRLSKGSLDRRIQISSAVLRTRTHPTLAAPVVCMAPFEMPQLTHQSVQPAKLSNVRKVIFSLRTH